MKKMKRLLVAMLSCLTAFACVAGLAACGDDDSSSSSTQKPAASSSSVTSTVESSSVEESSSVVESSSEEESSSVEESSKVEESSSAKDPAEHVHTWLREPSCLNNGECSECGIVEQSMLGHSIASWTTEKEPTCTAEGSQIGYCTRCELTVTEGLPKKAHDYVETTAKVEPECGKNGAEAILECTVCHTAKGGTVIPALEHELEVVAGKAATCTEDGLEEAKVCKLCGETVSGGKVIAALGHDWKDGIAPSCTEDGTCTRCEVVVKATGHAASVCVPQIVPTCETAGTTTLHYECPVCHEVDKELTPKDYKEIPAGHLYGTYVGQEVSAPYFAAISGVSYKDGKITVDATHAVSCNHGAVCYRCGEEVTTRLAHQYKTYDTTTVKGWSNKEFTNLDGDKLDMKFAGGETTNSIGVYSYSESEEKDGKTNTTYYVEICQICNVTTAEAHHPINHQYKWTKVVTKATCTEDGLLEHSACTVAGCDVEEGTTVIEAKGHNYTKKATCVAEAECKDCGKLEGTALGHTFERADFDTTGLDIDDSATWAAVGYIPAQEATCTNPGWDAHFYCTVCNAVQEYVEIEKLGHNYYFVDATSNSCTEDGMKAHYVCLNDCCEDIVWNVKTTTENANVEVKDVVYDDNGKATYYTVGSTTNVALLTVKATGHSFDKADSYKDDYVAAKAATCEVDGCTEGGYCKNEKGYVASEVIPALGHDGDRTTNWQYDEDGNVKENSFKLLSSASKRATCKAEAYCGLCGKTQLNWVDSDAYNYLTSLCDEEGTFVAKKSATCEADGALMDYTICACGCIKVDGSAVKEYYKDTDGNDTAKVKSWWTKTDVVDTIKSHSGENLVIHIEKKDATCTEDGYEAYDICRFCGKVIGSIKTISKLGHYNADEGKTCQTAFDCERVVRYETDENGEVKKDEDGNPIVAEVCGEHYEIDASKAKAHSYEKRDTGLVDEKGNTVYALICTGCGAKKED